MQQNFENVEFVQGVNFECKDSLKNNGTNCLLFFDDSHENVCNSKAIFVVASAGRHRGLGAI